MHSERPAERGIALVEFALILPLLLALTLGVMELIHSTNVAKVASQLSREAANLALRQCTESASVVTCLQSQQTLIQNFARNNGFAGTEVIISYYKTSDAASPVLTQVASSGVGTYPTRFAADGSGFAPEIKSLKGQSMYIAEVYIPYTAVVRRIAGVFDFGLTFLYDVTVA
jgi:Flp pilus assembly protein TadG